MSNYNPNIPAEYQPLGMWAYFGYELLFLLPCVGWILVIILSFAPRNKNLKNFARSHFCIYIIALIAIIIMMCVLGGAGALFSYFG